MDGLSATRLIRQKELRGEGLLGTALTSRSRAGKQLTIIAVTANVRDEQIKAAIEAGSVRDPLGIRQCSILTMFQDAVVQKPFKVQNLIDKIRTLTVKTPQRKRAATNLSFLELERDSLT